MGFENLSKKIQDSLSIKKSASRHYKSEEDVDSLHSIITDLIDSIENIEYYFSYCEDEYEKLVLEKQDLESKMVQLLHDSNLIFPNNKYKTVSLPLNVVSDLFMGLSKDKSFSEEYGVEMYGTQMMENPIEKLWVYAILDEKKWMLAKIKYGI